MSHRDSQSHVLVQEEEKCLQNGDPQPTGRALLGLLLIIGCGGSAMKLDNSILNYSFAMLCLTLARDLFPLEALSWTNTEDNMQSRQEHI